MADMYNHCYECGKNCIETSFCAEGASYDTNETDGISVPRNLKVKIIANPAFWGFSGVLIEGWARYENGYFDFFDGFKKDHSSTKECGDVTYGPFKNEQRPDVFYRSVYDPDGISKHYGADGVEDEIERGGAEVYLVDRPAGLVDAVTEDKKSCDDTKPTQIFKKFPENFGFGTKIAFNEGIYKNVTGAWRLIDINSCYEVDTSASPFYAKECDGTYKENIVKGEFGLFTEVDKYSYRINDGSGCLPDGAVPHVQSGTIAVSGIHRSGEDLVSVNISYNNSEVKAAVAGSQLFLENADEFSGARIIAHVQNNTTYSTVKLAGTWGSGDIGFSGSNGRWYLANTYDEQSCCGKAAYGLDYETKRPIADTNYHSDFGKVINNTKNIIQSNRLPDGRETYGLTVNYPSGTGVVRVDTTYPSIDQSGHVTLESGFPVFEKKLPYYGAFYETDQHDKTVRSDGKYNTITGRNLTCYSKKATLDIFPDCLTQYAQYDECETGEDKYVINRIKRLGFVYRGCNFHDKCSFNEDGAPYVHPTGIEDLKAGLAGQEMYMYINLNSAWGGEITRCMCDCSDEPPDGTLPPVMVSVQSPVTFPCLIKFDLRPEEYGCDDIRYQMENYKKYTDFFFDHEACDPFPEMSGSCYLRQPYTTYGFIRNLCGKETQSRKNVITEAFAKLVQDGNYRNTTTSVNVNEPMYWEFTNPGPQPAIFATGDWNGSITGGFADSGLYPYWGLSDQNGNLVAPYFRAKQGSYTCCIDAKEDYIDFDAKTTFEQGWPTDAVPFLIEIDHDDICAGCTTVTMDTKDLVLTLEGLDTKYSHNQDYDETTGGKYGYNNCKYDEVSAALDTPYSCELGHPDNYCAQTGSDNYYPQHGNPYIGNTCACITNTDIRMKAKNIGSSNLPLGWISNYAGSGEYTQGSNSFVNLSGCKHPLSDLLNEDYFSGAAGGYSVYGSFRLACPENIPFLDDPVFPFAFYLGSPVSNLWGCNNGDCSNSYPAEAGNGKMELNARFFIVSDARRADFEALTENDLVGVYASDIMANGISVGPPINSTSANVQLCPGDKVLVYGCAINGSFYPCEGCTPEDVCVSCSGEGVVCNDCGDVTSVDGYPTRRVPANFELNSCKCQCKDPALMRIYDVEPDGSLVLDETFETYPCEGTPYWIALSGVDRGLTDPLLIDQGPPFPHIGIGPFTVIAKDYCSFQTGVNSLANEIKYKIKEPYTDSCGSLSPSTCDTGTCEDSRARSSICGDPIPFLSGGSGVQVIRESCYPEVMIVNKVSCGYIGDGMDGFTLTVSREYHGHDRTWYKTEIVDGLPVCMPIQTGGYLYGGCNTYLWANPTDSVTPAFEGKCSVHYSSGDFANQDFLYTNKPVSSGDTLWNYYNLFPNSGSPNYIDAVDSDCISVTPVVSGVIFGALDETNKQYSCLQDITDCGADLFCNKMFFPRRPYKAGTKISPFGALKICTPNAKLGTPGYYTGGPFGELQSETETSRFIDACDQYATVILREDIDTNTTEIVVSDYLPLIGIKHPTWKNTTDIKSCITPASGSCDFATMPSVHTNLSLKDMNKGPWTFNNNGRTSMGYYYDSTVQESDNCIFNQFKILVDVECCNNRVRRIGNELDQPTTLEFVFTDVPSPVCKGLITNPPCSCGDSNCSDINMVPGACTAFYIITYTHGKIMCSGVPYALQPPSALVGEWVLADSFGASDAAGSTMDCTTNMGGSFFTHPCYSGQYVERTGPYYARMWVCGEYGYMFPASLGSSNTDPNCCGQSATLCSALGNAARVKLGPGCNHVEYGVVDSVGDITGIWKNDCGCDYKKAEDTACSETSIIKATITEDID